MAAFLEKVPRNVLVVADEAYHEYVDAPGLTTALGFADRHPNLVVTRTFSKAYGMAGLRVGYMVAHPDVVAILERLRESFNVNSVALAGAAAALADRPWLAKARAFNRAEREWLREELLERGYRCLPSQTNFLLCVLPRDASKLERHLFERGVIVRPMGGYGLPRALRISVGNRAENRRLLRALP
jgi:histidinol-phosphate aminotransferase